MSRLVPLGDLSCEEELLLLLHYAGEAGMTRSELGKHAQRAPSSITDAVKKLASPDLRQVLTVGGKLVLMELGSKRVREELADKLLVQ